jgi:hypothetical protein
LASPQVISEKKSQKKKLIFLELKKDIVKKKKVNFFLDILNQNFVLFHLKKISSLAHRELPQICVGSSARNTFAARKTLAAHCRSP